MDCYAPIVDRKQGEPGDAGDAELRVATLQLV